VLVVHGGRSISKAPVRAWHGAVLRLRPIARAIARRDRGLAVYRLQLAGRGWNGAGVDAIRDARWALESLRIRHPGVPIVLIGHSMGARTCMRIAGDPDVAGVVGLASWLPPDEPIRQLAGRPVRLIHGTRDRMVPEASTRPFVARALHAGVDLDQVILEDTGHAMLSRWNDWNELAAEAVRDILAEHAAASSRSAARHQ
jgi:alpha-beta hydrolase superfamily lysophospholipase